MMMTITQHVILGRYYPILASHRVDAERNGGDETACQKRIRVDCDYSPADIR